MWPTLDPLRSLRHDLDSLFEQSLGDCECGWSPALDVYQNPDDIVVIAELPGMNKEEIEISLHDGTLTIAGERKHEGGNGDPAERSERYVGKFRREISLSVRVDANKVSATYRDGILTVTLAKAEEAKPKQIQIKA